MEKTQTNRLESLDAFRTIAMFLVLILHGTLPQGIDSWLSALCRIAVLYFFLVSGYFAVHQTDRQVQLKRLKRHGIQLLTVELVSRLVWLAKAAFGKVTLGELLADMGAPYLLLNISFVSGHMWFLRALIYMELLFLTPAAEFLRGKGGLWCALAVWAADMVLTKYSAIFFGWAIPMPWFEVVTKFFGATFVFYVLGGQIRSRGQAWIRWVRSLGGRKQLGLLALLICGNLAEYGLLTHFSVDAMPCDYIMTGVLSVYCFLLLLSNPNWGAGTVLEIIGQKYSMYVYYWHMLVLSLCGTVALRLGISPMLYANPLAIFAETMAVVAAAQWLAQRMKGAKR